MHTFFHGWRRKAGVVTLMLACVVCSLWVDSYREVVLPEDFYPDVEWHQGNFEYTKFNSSAREVIWAIPIWPIVVPLTLLSAYLLLWKPRKQSGHA